MLGVVGFIQFAHKAFVLIIRDELLCRSVNFNLADFLHRVLFENVALIDPVEEDTKVTDIVVDRDGTDRLSVVSSPIWVIRILLVIIGIEGVFSSFL